MTLSKDIRRVDFQLAAPDLQRMQAEPALVDLYSGISPPRTSFAKSWEDYVCLDQKLSPSLREGFREAAETMDRYDAIPL